MVISKRKTIYFILFYIRYVLLLFKLRKKTILIICESDFHYFHIEPILEMAHSLKNIKFTVLKLNEFSCKRINTIRYIDLKKIKDEIFHTYDSCVYLDFNMPLWWVTGSVSFYLLHGVGPKVSYFATEKLKKFDIVLAPGPYIKSKQKKFLRSDAKILNSGLPITDQLFKLNSKQKNIDMGFNDGKPILLYAPSWSSDSNQISINEYILEELGNQKICNVILRPHPRLLVPEYCNGKDWKVIFEQMAGKFKHIKLYYGKNTPIYEIIPDCDMLMSDISSVLYEFMVLDRPVILYLKEGLDDFYNAQEYIEKTKNSCSVMKASSELKSLIIECIKDPKSHSKKRQELLDETFFYQGGSVKEVSKILSKY